MLTPKLTLAPFALVALVACSGPEGPPGPAGPSGPVGPVGATASADSGLPIGNRLRPNVVRVRAADGTEWVQATDGAIDTARSSEPCAPRVAADGLERCLPTRRAELGLYSDALCQRRLATVPRDLYANGVDYYAFERDEKGVRVLTTAKPVNDPSQVFAGRAGGQSSCVPWVGDPALVQFLEIGPEAGPTSFVQVGTVRE